MSVDLLSIKALPTFILEIFDNDIQRLANHTTIVDASLADGLVYKILVEDKFEEQGFETGFLYLTKGSSVKEHLHENDYIQHTVICGEMKVDGKLLLTSECKPGESHKIDPVVSDTLIYTYRKKQNIKQLFITGEQKKNLY